MTFFKQNGELLPERRGVPGSVFDSPGRGDNAFRVVRRGRRLGRFIKLRFMHSVFMLAALFLTYSATFGFKIFFNGNMDSNLLTSQEVQQGSSNVVKLPIKHRKQYPPCKVEFLESVNDPVEPKDFMNFTQFSLEYIDKEDKPFGTNMYKPRFGGHQTLQEREKSFYAKNQTLHCGSVNALPGFSSTGFDLDENDKTFMSTCKVVVSSCNFGGSDFLRRPTKKLVKKSFSQSFLCIKSMRPDDKQP